jgi:hypothetical protein
MPEFALDLDVATFLRSKMNEPNRQHLPARNTNPPSKMLGGLVLGISAGLPSDYSLLSQR